MVVTDLFPLQAVFDLRSPELKDPLLFYIRYDPKGVYMMGKMSDVMLCGLCFFP